MSTQEHIDRLVAARLACDVLGATTILVARTDAEAATLLDNNMDGRDHPFILGVTVPGVSSLHDHVAAGGKSEEWKERANLMTFGDAVVAKIDGTNWGAYKKRQMKNDWLASDPDTLSNAKARRVADSIFGEKNSVRVCCCTNLDALQVYRTVHSPVIILPGLL